MDSGTKRPQTRGLFHPAILGRVGKEKGEKGKGGGRGKGRPTKQNCRSPQRMSGGVNHMVALVVSHRSPRLFSAFHNQGKKSFPTQRIRRCQGCFYGVSSVYARREASDSECRSFFLLPSFLLSPHPKPPKPKVTSHRAETDPKNPPDRGTRAETAGF